ncbi:MAG: hypothetical protein RMM29_08465 [Planctomycetota bacterium]|nr:hypothetical protein [Planctomycetota bacterium]MDW8373660.1 hypothetical protein [Planctomycetota bacterium]
MTQWLAVQLPPGSSVELRVAERTLRGQVRAWGRGWLRLTTAQGEDFLINLEHIAWLRIIAAASLGAMLPTLPEQPALEGAATPPQSGLSDAQLKALVEGFLDDRTDRDLADAQRCARRTVSQVRAAWESVRGNLPEERVPLPARRWVPRLRAILHP